MLKGCLIILPAWEIIVVHWYKIYTRAFPNMSIYFLLQKHSTHQEPLLFLIATITGLSSLGRLELYGEQHS